MPESLSEFAFLTQEICYVRPNAGDRLGNERDHRGKAGQDQTFCVRKAIPVPAVPAPQQLRDHPNTNSTLLGVVPQLLRSGHSRYGNSFPNAKCLVLSGLPPVTACPDRYSTLLVHSILGIPRPKPLLYPPGHWTRSRPNHRPTQEHVRSAEG